MQNLPYVNDQWMAGLAMAFQHSIAWNLPHSDRSSQRLFRIFSPHGASCRTQPILAWSRGKVDTSELKSTSQRFFPHRQYSMPSLLHFVATMCHQEVLERKVRPWWSAEFPPIAVKSCKLLTNNDLALIRRAAELASWVIFHFFFLTSHMKERQKLSQSTYGWKIEINIV